jgi:N-carbamoylputrescine amidase
MKSQSIRLSMLHLAFEHDNVSHNVELLETLFLKALQGEPDIVMMPELAVSGYEFYKEIGKEWIREDVPAVIDKFSHLARDNETAFILSTPRYSLEKDKFYNAAIFIDDHGQVLGEHYKINVLPGSEGWSSPGFEIKPIHWNGHKIGLLICSDAYTENIAKGLANQGANVLISPAAWAPGMHEPNGEWEQRSKETGLCMYVCNRTGKEDRLNFEGSASAVIAAGHRTIEYSEKQPAILTIDVDADNWSPLDEEFSVLKV